MAYKLEANVAAIPNWLNPMGYNMQKMEHELLLLRKYSQVLPLRHYQLAVMAFGAVFAGSYVTSLTKNDKYEKQRDSIRYSIIVYPFADGRLFNQQGGQSRWRQKRKNQW
jgi:hypothetical protein